MHNFLDKLGRGLVCNEEFIARKYGPTDDFDAFIDSFSERKAYIKRHGFLNPTVDWLESMERFIGSRRVLEVCAGNGNLEVIMKGMGVDWTAIDRGFEGEYEFGEVDGSGVRKMDAMDALESIEHDIVFASWINYGSDLDYRVAVKCAERGVPFVMVGEGIGGCTGSFDFWESEDYVVTEMRNRFPWFKDFVPWCAVHDETYLCE